MIGTQIKKVREIKGYSQEYVAVHLNISQSAYSDLENNKTNLSLKRLQKIATVLETDILEFVRNNISNGDNQKENITSSTKLTTQLLEQLKAQYEKRLQEKDDFIELLKSQLTSS